MNRHAALSPLSRDHHGALLLAQLLKKSAPLYKGLPADLIGKAEYAIQFFNDELVKHFDEEEVVVIQKIKGIHVELDKLANDILQEHALLRNSFTSIRIADGLELHLDELGHALEKHIRKEEREFFPLIQELCSEMILSEIELGLSQ